MKTQEKTLSIHSENILPIIKKWLYSEKEIFARELVSNACDALHKVKVLRDQGQIDNKDEDLKIEITIDEKNNTLTFSDSGIGMTALEVEKYIAQIAFSSAEEFVETYKDKGEGDQIIGHFGLGFYSAYMVADKVEIDTLSFKEGSHPAHWSCTGNSNYTLSEGKREIRGTTITLYLNEEGKEFLHKYRIKEVLKHFCSFLPYPIFVEGERLNTQEPLWIKSPKDCTEEDYLNFYQHLYPMEDAPLFWVHLNVDYPFNLKGILYFHKMKRDFDFNKNSIKLFCNRVFVSDNCKDILPNYLMALQGVIDSPDIPLNVSRSHLQIDRHVRQISAHISKKVSDSLTSLYTTDKEKYEKNFADLSLVVKLGSVEDEKFYERTKSALIFKNLNGNYQTFQEYLDKNREKTKDLILYTKDAHPPEHLLELYKNKDLDVLIMDHPIDNYVVQQLEPKLTPSQFKRIDGEIHDSLIDSSREKTETSDLSNFITSLIGNENIEVQAKSLASDTLPALVVIKEEDRRMRDALRMMGGQEKMAAMLPKTKTIFVINTNAEIFSELQKLHPKEPALVEEIVQEIYDLSLLTQKEMEPEAVNPFITRTQKLLLKLLKTK
jgi:molecular chaperone HtpG